VCIGGISLLSNLVLEIPGRVRTNARLSGMLAAWEFRSDPHRHHTSDAAE